jgi:hypothetical protein
LFPSFLVSFLVSFLSLLPLLPSFLPPTLYFLPGGGGRESERERETSFKAACRLMPSIASLRGEGT